MSPSFVTISFSLVLKFSKKLPSLYVIMKQIEVVIINWMRPANVEKIIDALAEQTISCTITICDCHPYKKYALSEKALSTVNRLYRWTHNLGAYSRFVPLASFDHTYTLFLDDDLLPGKKCLEGFLNAANKIGKFGILGQLGRIIDEDGIYRPIDVERRDYFLETDFIIRAYFIETKYLHNIVKYRWKLNYFEEYHLEDDLLLCASIKYYENLPILLLPKNDDIEYLVNREELNTNDALSKRIDHRKRRIAFVKRLMLNGWKSINKISIDHKITNN